MRSASGSNHRARPGGVAAAIRVAIVTLCLPVHGCDTVSGGAVELSWKLRPASSVLADKFVDCDSEVGDGPYDPQPVTDIRLHWRVNGVEGSHAWRCQDNHGVTGFELPEGTAQLWVTPECATGPAAPASYIAPALLERTVSEGDTVSLVAMEIIVEVSYCGSTQPCICATGAAAGVAMDHTPSGATGAPLAYDQGVKQTVGSASKTQPRTTREGMNQ